MIKNQNGSALIVLLAVVACLSAFVVMEFMYEEEDMTNFYSEAEVEEREMIKAGEKLV